MANILTPDWLARVEPPSIDDSWGASAAPPRDPTSWAGANRLIASGVEPMLFSPRKSGTHVIVVIFGGVRKSRTNRVFGDWRGWSNMRNSSLCGSRTSEFLSVSKAHVVPEIASSEMVAAATIVTTTFPWGATPRRRPWCLARRAPVAPSSARKGRTAPDTSRGGACGAGDAAGSRGTQPVTVGCA